MRGGDDAHVYFGSVRGADPFNLSLLNQSQHLHLKIQRHLANFVQEEAALVCHFDLAFFVGESPGERALGMTKQFGFEQFLWDRAAVDDHEWPIAP